MGPVVIQRSTRSGRPGRRGRRGREGRNQRTRWALPVFEHPRQLFRRVYIYLNELKTDTAQACVR
jgi:hypothetical protein